jgi:hypothetical protein
VVRVHEHTIIGGWTSGPIRRKGTPEIAGWATVWSDTEQDRERVFSVSTESQARVYEIHRTLAREADSMKPRSARPTAP